MVEIDLASPSTKGGKLEIDEVVAFPGSIEMGTETFWTVPLLRLSIEGAECSENLPVILRFLSDSLSVLDEWPQKERVQWKMPIPLEMRYHSDISSAETYGENVTMIERKSAAPRRIYKEYCYHPDKCKAL
jgi:hypothetical protein